MVDQDILLAKIQVIKNCLERIHNTIGKDEKKLETFPEQDVFILNLQRAVQAVIDIAAHIVASENLGLPKTMSESFLLMERHKKISSALSKKLQAMVGFRNIAVHDYTEINVEILKSILKNSLKDLEDFCDVVKLLSSQAKPGMIK